MKSEHCVQDIAPSSVVAIGAVIPIHIPVITKCTGEPVKLQRGDHSLGGSSKSEISADISERSE
jgi:hypothetical protein